MPSVDLEYIRSFKTRWPMLIEAADHPLTELLIERRDKGIWPYSGKMREVWFHIYILLLISVPHFLFSILRDLFPFFIAFIITILCASLLSYPLYKYFREKKEKFRFKNNHNPAKGLLRILTQESEEVLAQFKLTALTFREIVAIEAISSGLSRRARVGSVYVFLFLITAVVIIDYLFYWFFTDYQFQLIGHRIAMYALFILFVLGIENYLQNITFFSTIKQLEKASGSPNDSQDFMAIFFIILSIIGLLILIMVGIDTLYSDVLLNIIFCGYLITGVFFIYAKYQLNDESLDVYFDEIAENGKSAYSKLEF